MNKFSYAAAYLSENSQKKFKNLGIDKTLHITTCFDNSATISENDNISVKDMKATIKEIKEWNTPNGVYLVAELSDCDWSKKVNEHFTKLGAVEDLPHKPHMTLLKEGSKTLMESLQVLIGEEIEFDKHVVKVKEIKSKNNPKF